jgi:hypothetical protein
MLKRREFFKIMIASGLAITLPVNIAEALHIIDRFKDDTGIIWLERKVIHFGLSNKSWKISAYAVIDDCSYELHQFHDQEPDAGELKIFNATATLALLQIRLKNLPRTTARAQWVMMNHQLRNYRRRMENGQLF